MRARSSYLLQTPVTGGSHYINVTAGSTESVVLDGEPLDPVAAAPVVGTDLVVYRQAVGPGPHILAASARVGMVVYGHDHDSAYRYSGGMRVRWSSQRSIPGVYP